MSLVPPRDLLVPVWRRSTQTAPQFHQDYTAAMRAVATNGVTMGPFVSLRDVFRATRIVAFIDRCDQQTLRLAQGARLKGRPWPRTTITTTR